MFSKWRSKKEEKHAAPVMEIIAPVSGRSFPLSEVPDETFAGGHMGEGIAIEPSVGQLVAPFDGKVAHIVKTNHAVILEHSSGLQLLLHIGIDTVSLKGSGFISHIATGDTVKAGQTLIEFDMDVIRAAGLSTITPVIVTSSEDFTFEVESHLGPVTSGKDRVLTVGFKETTL